MKASPTYIHFRVQWQVIGPESPGQRFERGKFEEFFHALNKDRYFSGYDDFSYRPDRCELAKDRGRAEQGGKAFSKVEYSNDTLTVVEEYTDHSADEFSQKIKILLDAWFGSFPQTAAVVQSSCLRALLAPVHFHDSREFLGNAILGLGDAFQSQLEKGPHKVGFTFACQRTPSDGVTINLDASINSWRDNRSIWVETVGVALLRQPLNAARHDQAEVVFGRCRKFLEEEVIRLLTGYDEEGNKAPGDT